MDPGVVFGLVLGGLAIVGALIAVVVLAVRSHVNWQLLPGAYPVQYVAYAGFDTAKLAAAIGRAIDVLAVVWPKDAVRAVALRSQYAVAGSVSSWTDTYGRQVAGLADGATIMVGGDLAALAHELAHRCEAELDGKVDFNHASWGARGIFAAIDQYAATLATS